MTAIRKPTLRDVASAVGVSTATASFVMNGSWEERRINAQTAERVRAAALTLQYRPNRRARALRMSRSSLAGLILPYQRDRFFAGLAENFERQSHARNLVPVIGSTQRDPVIEARLAASMIEHEVEFLVLAGVDDPGPINAMARENGVRCVNVDLPGPGAFSVSTDNRGGAYDLTKRLLGGLPADATLMFLGGREAEYATDLRVDGLLAALADDGRATTDATIVRCGYDPVAVQATLTSHLESGDPIPHALLVNSITAFEGFATTWRRRQDDFRNIRVACFDWDPFAACLPITTIMLRQNVGGLMDRCFRWFDEGNEHVGEVVLVSADILVSGSD